MTAPRCWVLTIVGLTIVVPLLAGALQLVSQVAVAAPPALPPTPRASAPLLVREVGGYTPTPLVRSTAVPALAPSPPEAAAPQAPAVAANDAGARPPAPPAPAR